MFQTKAILYLERFKMKEKTNKMVMQNMKRYYIAHLPLFVVLIHMLFNCTFVKIKICNRFSTLFIICNQMSDNAPNVIICPYGIMNISQKMCIDFIKEFDFYSLEY